MHRREEFTADSLKKLVLEESVRDDMFDRIDKFLLYMVICCVLCLPATIAALIISTSLDESWVGGGGIPVPPIVISIALAPAALCGLSGLSSLAVAIAARKTIFVLWGLLALVLAALSLLIVGWSLAMMSIG